MSQRKRGTRKRKNEDASAGVKEGEDTGRTSAQLRSTLELMLAFKVGPNVVFLEPFKINTLTYTCVTSRPQVGYGKPWSPVQRWAAAVSPCSWAPSDRGRGLHWTIQLQQSFRSCVPNRGLTQLISCLMVPT